MKKVDSIFIHQICCIFLPYILNFSYDGNYYTTNSLSLYIYICIYMYIILQAAVVSILLYGCTSWTLTKRIEKKLDGNYTRMLRSILNKSWRQHSKKQLLYGHLPPIIKAIEVRRTRHAGHCLRSREIISDILLWTHSHGRAKAGRSA